MIFTKSLPEEEERRTKQSLDSPQTIEAKKICRKIGLRCKLNKAFHHFFFQFLAYLCDNFSKFHILFVEKWLKKFQSSTTNSNPGFRVLTICHSSQKKIVFAKGSFYYCILIYLWNNNINLVVWLTHLPSYLSFFLMIQTM